MLSRRVKGYLIAGATGLALGIIVDAVDVEVLLKKREKLTMVLSSGVLVVSAVVAAFYEPPPGNQKGGSSGPPLNPHGDSNPD